MTLDRLRREVATAGEDEQLRELLAEAEEAMADRDKPARDVTLDELRVELIYPADEAAEAAFRRLAG